MRRYAVAVVTVMVLIGLVACGSGPPKHPLAKELAQRLERAGLCDHPRLNRHRRREVLCATRRDGGRTGVATFETHRRALRSLANTRRSVRYIGCDFHAPAGPLTLVLGPRFVVVGSDQPAEVARVLRAKVLPPAEC